MAQIKGTVSRIFVEVKERSYDCSITLLLIEHSEIFKGKVTRSYIKDGNDIVKLTAIGDTVEFDYDQDFNNYLRNFTNHTLAEML